MCELHDIGRPSVYFQIMHRWQQAEARRHVMSMLATYTFNRNITDHLMIMKLAQDFLSKILRKPMFLQESFLPIQSIKKLLGEYG